MTASITSFQGPYRFLSNFYPATVVVDGNIYPSVEHAFQAAKTLIEKEREYIRLASTPAEAKRIGRRISLRPDWESIRKHVMTDLVYQKFSRHLDLREKLVATKDLDLVEGNWWHDNDWGRCGCKQRAACDGISGSNWLGNILMYVRSVYQ